jgi:hypothetical protein
MGILIKRPLYERNPDADLRQSVNLSASGDGRPMAEVMWMLTVDGQVATDQQVTKDFPPALREELLAKFRADIGRIVCAQDKGFTSEGRFIRSGGIVSYSLYLLWTEKATVVIDHCEAP